MADDLRDEELLGAFAPLGQRGFRSLWTASVFSNVGSWFQITAGSWLIWELTASPAWVGWMNGSRSFPLLFLALPAGVIADRFSRSSVLIITQSAMGLVAVAMAILTWMGLMTAGLLLGLGMALGVGMAFHAPAWQSMVPHLVPRHMVTAAIALNSVSFNAARAVGPALGGLVVAGYGAAAAFGINAVSYVAVLAVLIVVIRGTPDGEHERSSALQSMLVGVRFAAFTPAFRRLLMLGSLYALGTAVIQAMLPVRAEELGGSVGTYGLLLGLMGVGAAGGGILVTRVNRRLRALSIPVTVALTGVTGLLIGVAPTVALTAVPMMLSGAAWVLTLATINGTVQMLSPDWVRGRAASLWLLAYAGMVPIGAIMSGAIAERLGAGPTMALLSAATVVLGVGAAFGNLQDPAAVDSPEFNRERRIHQHPDVSGGPVMIVNTWRIPEGDLDEFLAVMHKVRLARMSTGGQRWQLFRDLGGKDTYCEVFYASSWEEHLRQHARLDDAMAAVLGRARQLDVSEGGPTSRHYLGTPLIPGFQAGPGVDIDDHDSLHSVDGSVPLLRRILGQEGSRS